MSQKKYRTAVAQRMWVMRRVIRSVLADSVQLDKAVELLSIGKDAAFAQELRTALESRSFARIQRVYLNRFKQQA